MRLIMERLGSRELPAALEFDNDGDLASYRPTVKKTATSTNELPRISSFQTRRQLLSCKDGTLWVWTNSPRYLYIQSG